MGNGPSQTQHDGGMMELVILLVRSGDYGRSENREKQVRRSTKQRKMLEELLTRSNINHKGNYMETLCDESIKNVTCLRLQ